jgi:hypothetical protein
MLQTRRNYMSFLRHIGKHNDRKVAVIFREVPGEPHMCLVTYPEILNRHIHDPLMKCIESDIGQHSENLADALHRTYTIDGKIILQALHAEGQLKKVNTEQIVMTPAPNTQIRLHELNKMLNEMKQGEDAVKRMAELDSSRGLQDPADVARRMRGDRSPAPVVAPTGDALGDQQIAANLRTQAERMQREATGLLAEATRMMNEAASLDGVAVESKPKAKTAKTAKVPVKATKPKAKKSKAEA